MPFVRRFSAPKVRLACGADIQQGRYFLWTESPLILSSITPPACRIALLTSDTPYAGGLFRLEISIPQRYPFEPPVVRFMTPIYHPNVDTAGRICLDLLKSQPRGTWKPSVSLSALLTSIQLLMAEPNPDDGLLPDVVRLGRHSVIGPQCPCYLFLCKSHANLTLDLCFFHCRASPQSTKITARCLSGGRASIPRSMRKRRIQQRCVYMPYACRVGAATARTRNGDVSAILFTQEEATTAGTETSLQQGTAKTSTAHRSLTRPPAKSAKLAPVQATCDRKE